MYIMNWLSKITMLLLLILTVKVSDAQPAANANLTFGSIPERWYHLSLIHI